VENGARIVSRNTGMWETASERSVETQECGKRRSNSQWKHRNVANGARIVSGNTGMWQTALEAVSGNTGIWETALEAVSWNIGI
jgi:hypothetical protein